MAEGLLRREGDGGLDVFSAGTRPGTLRAEAIVVMNEIGIDISAHRAKSVDEFTRQEFDYVITVCDNAAESCPAFPGNAKRLHWPFEDPAAVEGTQQQREAAFRRIRDQIREKIVSFLGESGDRTSAGSQ